MYLKIGGTVYEIEYIPNLKSPEDNSSLNGRVTWTDSKIRVRKGLGRQRKNQVLIHEAVHGILEDYYISDEDEGVVVKLANGIYSFIVDNADFIKGIIKYNEKLKKQTKN